MLLNANKNIYTQDAEEIARFSAICAEWWDESGAFKPLHQLNPTRMHFIQQTICSHFEREPTATTPLQGLKILDVGCGGGLVAEPLCRQGADVTGIDASAATIAVAQAHAQLMHLNINYKTAAVEDMDPDDRYDVITALEIVEHVSDVQGFVNACAALLKPNGLLIMSTLNRTLKSYAIAIVGAEYIMRWLPVGTHQWRKFMTPAELAQNFRHAGLVVGATRGLSFSPLSWSWSLSNDLDVNYLMAARKV